MRICFVNIMQEEFSKPYLFYVKKVFEKFSKDTTYEILTIDNGLEHGTDVKYPYFTEIVLHSIVEKVREAERLRFDGVIIGCFDDIGLKESKSIVDIPVVGPGEASYLLACMMGHKYGVLTLHDKAVIAPLNENILKYGLCTRGIFQAVRMMSMPFRDLFTKGMENPRLVIESIKEDALNLIEDGAEVVILGCVGVGPLFTSEGVSYIEVNERKLPIVDCVSAAIAMIKMLIDLRNGISIPIVSRIGYYSKPREKDLKRLGVV